MSETEYLLEITNLNKIYRSQNTNIFSKKRASRVLDNISLSIKKGEILGLVGESGCGKSTLGRCIVNLIKDYEGDIFLEGQNINGIKNISKKVQIIFQDPLSSLNPKKKIGWILEEPLKIHKIGKKHDRIKSVNKILEIIGLDSTYQNRYPYELSGGQRQRISIGAALMLNPMLIVADEPVSALDVSVQAQILNLMKDLHERMNLSYLFISHNLDVIYYMCHRVAVMYLGKIVELASVDDIYDNPLHPYTKMLLDAIPHVNEEKKNNINKIFGEVTNSDADIIGCPFYQRCFSAIGICREKCPDITIVKDMNGSERYVRCHLFK